MTENEILSKAADVLVQSSVKIKVDVICTGLIEKYLIKLGLRKKVREFEMKPLTYAKGIRITKLLIEINADIFKKTDNILSTALDAYANHGDKIAKCIAIAIGDGRMAPDKRLVKFFTENLTPKEGIGIANIIISQLDLSSFMTTIISMKGMSLMKQRETIAPGQSSAA